MRANGLDICALTLGRHLAALPMDAVREVLIHPRLSPMPLAPSLLHGLVPFRGEVVPIFILDSLLEFDSKTTSNRHRAVIAHSSSGLLGLLVDQVDRLSLPEAPPMPPGALSVEITAAGKTLQLVSPNALAQRLRQLFAPVQLNAPTS